MEVAKDFFISYSQSDRAWAEWIAWRLEEVGYTTVVQAWDIAAGFNFVVAMHNAAREARRTIAVLSPDYLTSQYAQSEWAAAFVQDPTGEKGVLLPVLVRPCAPDGLLASLVYIDLTACDEAEAQATLLAKVKTTRAKPSIAPGFPGNAQVPVSFPGRKSLVWNIPYPRNPFFTGRAALLEDLHRRFTTTKALALSGLGGIGKTQLAIEYAYRYEHVYRYVLWANAASSESLLSDFVSLAALLEAPGYDAQQQPTAIKAVQRWLAEQKEWLLILDNADAIAMVRGFLPTRSNASGHVLLTTRAQATRAIAQPFTIDKMEKDEAILLLLQRTGVIESDEQVSQASVEEYRAAEDIVEIMDGLPLALDQAGSYIDEIGCSLIDYLQVYRTHRKDLLGREGQLSADYPETVATTWALAFQRIEQENPAAAALLQFCAFLAPDAIPEELILASANEANDVLGLSIAEPFAFNAALEILRRYSLLRRNTDTKMLTIHRLVQIVLQENMSVEIQQFWAEHVIRVVNTYFNVVVRSDSFHAKIYLPHINMCLELIDRYAFIKSISAQLLLNAGSYLREHAFYKESEIFYLKAVSILEKIGEYEIHSLAEALYQIGQLYYLQDRYQESESFYLRALSLYQTFQDWEDAIAEVQLALGQLYHLQGYYQKGEELYRDALKYYEAASNDGKFQGIARQGLAVLYEERGDYQKAEEVFKTASSTVRLNLSVGISQFDLHMALDVMMRSYKEKDEYEKIEEVYRELLDKFERLAGPEHPHIATILHELAWYKRSQDNYDEADVLYQRALHIREKSLGIEHTNTALTLHELALLRREQFRDEEAEQLFLQVLQIREKILGTDHVSTGAILHELARLYEDQSKYDEAILFYQRALRTYEKVLGAEHPDIAMVLNEITRVYEAQGKYDIAIQIGQKALSIHENMQSTDPRYITSILQHLAALSQSQNNYEQAVAYYQRALVIQEKEPGIKHSDAIKTISDYATLLHKMGREGEAAELEARIQQA